MVNDDIAGARSRLAGNHPSPVGFGWQAARPTRLACSMDRGSCVRRGLCVFGCILFLYFCLASRPRASSLKMSCSPPRRTTAVQTLAFWFVRGVRRFLLVWWLRFGIVGRCGCRRRGLRAGFLFAGRAWWLRPGRRWPLGAGRSVNRAIFGAGFGAFCAHLVSVCVHFVAVCTHFDRFLRLICRSNFGQ